MIHCRLADLASEKDAAIIIALVDDYAQDPMGGAQALAEQVKASMVEGMRNTPGCFVIIAESDDLAVGLANCFTAFSTFKAKPLVNIHDLCVHHDWRGKGIGAALLKAVADEANKRDCCKITLEVRDDNQAKRLYEREGFKAGPVPMWFLTKEL
jgi:ribosomal protein S18 acetylase RimI-like enzyme